jgi:hypothetical protein
MHAAVAVSWPPQRDLLQLTAQIHVGFLGLRSPQEAVVSRPTHSRGSAELVHGCPRFGRFPDLFMELASPLATTR